jgi:hypothetical protein
MELLTPSFNGDWVDSAKMLFLAELDLKPEQLSNYEPKYFTYLVARNPGIYAEIVTDLYEGEDELNTAEEYLKDYLDIKVSPGVTVRDYIGMGNTE